MLYLEARCLMVVKAAGSQGVQNGAISCIALPLSLPAGVRGVLAENLMAASLGLELASGNDALSSHSDIRKSAKLMLQLLPGTDFVTSGYSVVPRGDNLFGGGNFDSDDLDVWTLLQRDLQTDGGITPVSEERIQGIRERAARAVQALYEELGFPPITNEEVAGAVECYSSDDMPVRSQAADLRAAHDFFQSTASVLDVARALQARGFDRESRAILALTRQRAAGDYLQPSGILCEDGKDLVAVSCINHPHAYSGPGTGCRVKGGRWEALAEVPFAIDPRQITETTEREALFVETEEATVGQSLEVVLAVGPAFAHQLNETLAGLSHRSVVQAILNGIDEIEVPFRIIRVRDTADCAFIGHRGAQLSGSGIAIGLQSRGTAVIHRRDLAPLANLELLSQAPNLTLESYRALGHNAACYASQRSTEPVPVRVDNTARLKHIVRTTLFHRCEVEAVTSAHAVVLKLKGSEETRKVEP
jgi:hypothetical protein